MARLNPFAAVQDGDIANDVLQLANIAWPFVSAQSGFHFERKSMKILTLIATVTLQEIMRQEQYIAAVLAQRWQLYRHHLQAIV